MIENRTLGPVSSFALRAGLVFGCLLVAGLFLQMIEFPISRLFSVIFTAVVLSLAISPAVAFLNTRFHVPKWLSVTTIYLGLLAALGGVITLLVPLAAHEVQMVAHRLPEWTAQATSFAAQYGVEVPEVTADTIMPHIQEGLAAAGHGLRSILGFGVSAIVDIIVALVMSIFLTAELGLLEKALSFFALPAAQESIHNAVGRVRLQIGYWARGALLVGAIFGTTFGLALWLIGVPYAFTIGFTGAVLDLIPFVGTVTALTLALLVTLTQLPHPLIPVIIILGVYVGITQLKDHVITPKVMESFLGIHKLAVLCSLFACTLWLGLLGTLLALPLAIVGKVLKEEIHAAIARRRPEPVDPPLAVDPLPPTMEDHRLPDAGVTGRDVENKD
jgi:predicted PurR-regulated permease PerM